MTTEMLLALGAAGLCVFVGTVLLIALAVHKSQMKRTMDKWKLSMYEEVKHHSQRVDGMAGQYRTLKKEAADRNNKVGDLEKRVKDLEETVSGEGGLFEKIDEVLLSVDHILDNDWEDEDYVERPTQTMAVLPQYPPSRPLNGKGGK